MECHRRTRVSVSGRGQCSRCAAVLPFPPLVPGGRGTHVRAGRHGLVRARRSGSGAPGSGQAYANQLRRRRPRPGDKWYTDEVFLKINGRLQYLWRAVDQDGNVLDILVQSKRNTQAAKRFFRRLLKEYEYVPRVIVTDKLRSYGAAHREVMPSAEHRSSKYLNKRAENSHQPTRRRERAIRRFTSPGHAQRSPSAFSGIPPRFRPRHHLLTTRDYRTETTHRFTTWRQATNCAATA